MSYSIAFNPEAIADLAKIDRLIQLRIARKIKWLGENFAEITPIALTGNLANFFKLRVGDYRVIYTGGGYHWLGIVTGDVFCGELGNLEGLRSGDGFTFGLPRF